MWKRDRERGVRKQSKAKQSREVEREGQREKEIEEGVI